MLGAAREPIWSRASLRAAWTEQDRGGLQPHEAKPRKAIRSPIRIFRPHATAQARARSGCAAANPSAPGCSDDSRASTRVQDGTVIARLSDAAPSRDTAVYATRRSKRVLRDHRTQHVARARHCGARDDHALQPADAPLLSAGASADAGRLCTCSERRDPGFGSRARAGPPRSGRRARGRGSGRSGHCPDPARAAC